MKARYRASVLGFLWTFLNPTLNMVVYALVFGYLLEILGVGDDHFQRKSLAKMMQFSFTRPRVGDSRRSPHRFDAARAFAQA